MHKLLWLLILLSSCSISKKNIINHPFQGDQIGCGNFIVYKLSEDNREFVSIAFDANAIEYKSTQAFGIEKTDLLEVKWKKFDATINETLCNDVRGGSIKKTQDLTAKSGLVEITLNESEMNKASRNEGYEATIVLRNVIFEDKEIDFLLIENIYIGWLPG